MCAASCRSPSRPTIAGAIKSAGSTPTTRTHTDDTLDRTDWLCQDFSLGAALLGAVRRRVWSASCEADRECFEAAQDDAATPSQLFG